MNRAIWKYPLDLYAVENDAPLMLAMPTGAHLLYATVQSDRIIIYAMVDPTVSKPRLIDVWVVGTGQPMPATLPDDARPLGVVSLHNGGLMLHVFCRTDDRP